VDKDDKSSGDLEHRLEQARRAWPGVEIDEAAFCAYLAERGGGSLPSASSTLRLDELYLCCGCAQGDDQALVAFGDRFRPAIIHAVSKVVARAQVDDVVQQVLAKLFVARDDKPAAIRSFLGTGKLATWLQVVARREASNAARADRTSQPDTSPSDEIDELYAQAMADDSGAMPQLKLEYRTTFKQAFREALAQLSSRERNLLRYECIDGLTSDQVAAIYCVSRSTIARWRASSRKRLYRTTRSLFNERVGIAPSEFGTVMRLIESQLNVSLTRLLRQPGD
jgi:RNA polymerase sigma-70 factor (ECF subfamily)